MRAEIVMTGINHLSNLLGLPADQSELQCSLRRNSRLHSYSKFRLLGDHQ